MQWRINKYISSEANNIIQLYCRLVSIIYLESIDYHTHTQKRIREYETETSAIVQVG